MKQLHGKNMKSIRLRNYIINTPIEEILQQIKAELTNGKLRDIKIGRDDIAVTCPNDEHSNGMEHDPDCHINIDDNKSVPYGYFNCFACGAKGTFVRFVAMCFSESDSYAERWLASRFGEYVENEFTVGDYINLNKSKINQAVKLDTSVLQTLQDWCPYLATRKLTYDTCTKFGVKYDAVHRQVVFPCYDTRGNLVMLPRRSIDSKVFYLDKNIKKPVYCLDNIVKNNIKQAIITEGPIDCLLGNQYGVPTIATLGKISDYQIEQINKSGLTVLYTMFDNDEAGKSFADLIKKRVAKYIIVINIPIPNGFKDIGDLDYETFWKIFNKYKNSNNIIV